MGKGVGRTIDAFGSSLRARYHRTTVREANYTELRYLGYFTNNGAAYYYNTLHGNASYTGGPAEFNTFELIYSIHIWKEDHVEKCQLECLFRDI